MYSLYVLKPSRATSRVNVELKLGVSETSSVSIVRVDMENDRMSNRRLFLLAYDAVRGWNQTVRPPIRLCPLALLLNLVSLLPDILLSL
jgi:hypothetical protein